MNRACIKVVLLVAVAVLASHSAVADVGGKITGTVKDQSDAAIDGVTVTAVNTATGAKQTTKTDAQGLYSFPVLSVGQYELDVAADGFRPYRRTGLVVDVNSALVVDVALQVAEHNESVTVTEASDTVQVEKTDTEMGQTINEKRITEVPLNGRSYTDLLAIQAGVNPATTNGERQLRRSWRIWLHCSVRRTQPWQFLYQWRTRVRERLHPQRSEC
jgi:hypothetical protein